MNATLTSEMLRGLGLPLATTALVRARIVASFAVALATIGCEPTTRPTSVVVRDSSGIEIVDNPVEPPARWRLGAEPVFDIGRADGDPDYLFSDIGGAVITAAGEVAVGDRGANRIRYYGGDGRYLRSVGGEGDGPGEFRWLATLWRRGDTLVAFDARLSRLSWFDAGGTYVRSSPPDGPHFGFLSDGTLLSPGIVPRDMPAPGTVSRGEADLVFRRGGSRDTVARFRIAETFVDEETESFSQRLFGRMSWVVFGPRHVFVGDNAAYQIRVYDASGVWIRAIRRSIAPRPVSEADRERWIAGETDRFAGDPRLELLVRPLRTQPTPELMPAFGRGSNTASRIPPRPTKKAHTLHQKSLPLHKASGPRDDRPPHDVFAGRSRHLNPSTLSREISIARQ
ncbi:MAG: hypothetical protein MJB57_10370 [Gemmatimonadetes bacterium]|nr:hypothetical protein [Gemmatimonadota bacterium]